MSALAQDLRHAFRLLARDPGFAAIAILTLMIGIGASTAIFSAVWGVALRPLGYDEPERLVSIWETLEQRGMNEVTVSPANFADWRARTRSFETMAAARSARFTLEGSAGPEHVIGAGVSEGFFEMLGIAPPVGGGLRFDGESPTALISHGFWVRRFQENPSVIGRTLMLDDQAVTIVGVLPASFFPPVAMSVGDAEVWLPLDRIGEDLETRGARFLSVAGRLKEGVTLEQAQTELRTIASGLAAEYPEDNEGWSARLVPLHEQTVGPVRPRLLILFAAVGLVLLISCANVTHLMLARSESRRLELAIRTALGGSRFRLARQMFVESLVLAAIGCAGGVLLAVQGSALLARFGPEEMPRRAEIGVDGAVVLFASVIALVAALLVGTIPALRLARGHGIPALRDSARTAARSGRKTTNVLVAAELALALILLAGAGLLLHSFARLMRVDPGFSAEQLLVVRVFAPDAYDSDEELVSFFDRIRERLAVIPGVESAAATNNLPFGGNNAVATFSIEGRPELTRGDPVISWNQISPGYFETMGITIRSGRGFRESDDASSQHVVVISESMARAYWPGQDPVGRRMKLGDAASSSPWLVVTGVVRDVRHRLEQEQGPTIYLSYRQNPRRGMFLPMRTSGDPAMFARAAREAVWAVDDDVPIEEVRTMATLRRESVAQQRFYSWLVGAFATVALALAVIGVYGVTAFAVARRTTEVGIRMALGAERGRVIRLLVRQMLPAVAAGALMGLAGAFALTRFLESLLFEVTPMDPAAIGLALAGLIVSTLAASLVPAARAALIQPLEALRQE